MSFSDSHWKRIDSIQSKFVKFNSLFYHLRSIGGWIVDPLVGQHLCHCLFAHIQQCHPTKIASTCVRFVRISFFIMNCLGNHFVLPFFPCRPLFRPFAFWNHQWMHSHWWVFHCLAFWLFTSRAPGQSPNPITNHSLSNLNRSGIPGTEHFTWRVFLIWSLALGCWLCDRILCELWLKLGTPYLHAIWHLLSSLAAYNVFILFSLLDIKRRAIAGQHNFHVQIRHFPSQKRFSAFAFPYLTVKEKMELEMGNN